MVFRQEDVEKFEQNWNSAEKYLGYMLNNVIVSDKMYQDLKSRIRSLESLVMDISDSVRSDKD